MSAVTAASAPIASQVTPASPIRQVGLLMQWQMRRLANWLPLLVVVQVLLSVTTVFGYGLLIGTPPPEAALYLATGAPTITLIMVGLVMTPQMVAQARTEGSLDWMRTLPVPRSIFLFADLAVWSLVALPGTVLGILIGAWRFDVTLSVSPWILIVAPLVSLIAATVGYGMASVMPAQVAQLLSQVLVFVVLLFTPISYPADRMPQWLATIHEWLPFQAMGEAMRATLVSDVFSMPLRSIILLSVWGVLAVAGASWALRRRV